MPADLNWVIENKWIADYKFEYSQQAGRDIGTPATVDKMFARRDQLRYSPYLSALPGRPADMGLIGLEVFDREELVEAYLFGPSIPDEHGKSQLEGELRRFVAQIRRISPKQIAKVWPQEVLNYLRHNDLPLKGTLANSIAERMQFDLKRAVRIRSKYLKAASENPESVIASGFL
ncbi:MAG: hypothetical protein ABH840_01720 [Nanoarchaeota archaeon]